MKRRLQRFTQIALMLFVFIISYSCNQKTSNKNFPVIDIDGNGYDTVRIGTQTWLKQNLNVTHYNNGDDIMKITKSSSWKNITFDAYCDYNNDPDNSAIYGRLYNWYAADSRNLCPTGWHVPSDSEWIKLIDIAGGKLKAINLDNSNKSGNSARNDTGFTALPGGCNEGDGGYYGMHVKGYWWSSTESGKEGARSFYLKSNDSYMQEFNTYKIKGFSVRCMKNQ